MRLLHRAVQQATLAIDGIDVSVSVVERQRVDLITGIEIAREGRLWATSLPPALRRQDRGWLDGILPLTFQDGRTENIRVVRHYETLTGDRWEVARFEAWYVPDSRWAGK